MDYPKIRYIEASQVTLDGQNLISLRDPENLSGNMLFVLPEATYAISLFDGNHSLEEIQSKFAERFGVEVSQDEIRELISRLDENYLLENENYHNFMSKLTEEFRRAKVRQCSHAGLSYPEDGAALKSSIDKYFNLADESHPINSPNGKVTGIVSPHIDYARGGKAYALAYRELRGIATKGPLTFVILGTSHYARAENPFIMTKKSFKTPFGEIAVNTEFVDEIAGSMSWDVYEGEISHRQEHSIEFQVVFLQYLFGAAENIRIVPVLCNSFQRLVEEGKSPSADERVSLFLKKLREMISERGDTKKGGNKGDNNRSDWGTIITIVSADMAHFGPKFGDPDPVNEDTLEWIKSRDMRTLSYTERIDSEGFYKSIEEEKDKRKICGLAPIYALLYSTTAKSAKVLHYEQALEPDTGSVVSFASLGIYD